MGEDALKKPFSSGQPENSGEVMPEAGVPVVPVIPDDAPPLSHLHPEFFSNHPKNSGADVPNADVPDVPLVSGGSVPDSPDSPFAPKTKPHVSDLRAPRAASLFSRRDDEIVGSTEAADKESNDDNDADIPVVAVGSLPTRGAKQPALTPADKQPTPKDDEQKVEKSDGLAPDLKKAVIDARSAFAKVSVDYRFSGQSKRNTKKYEAALDKYTKLQNQASVEAIKVMRSKLEAQGMNEKEINEAISILATEAAIKQIEATEVAIMEATFGKTKVAAYKAEKTRNSVVGKFLHWWNDTGNEKLLSVPRAKRALATTGITAVPALIAGAAGAAVLGPVALVGGIAGAAVAKGATRAAITEGINRKASNLLRGDGVKLTEDELKKHVEGEYIKTRELTRETGRLEKERIENISKTSDNIYLTAEQIIDELDARTEAIAAKTANEKSEIRQRNNRELLGKVAIGATFGILGAAVGIFVGDHLFGGRGSAPRPSGQGLATPSSIPENVQPSPNTSVLEQPATTQATPSATTLVENTPTTATTIPQEVQPAPTTPPVSGPTTEQIDSFKTTYNSWNDSQRDAFGRMVNEPHHFANMNRAMDEIRAAHPEMSSAQINELGESTLKLATQQQDAKINAFVESQGFKPGSAEFDRMVGVERFWSAQAPTNAIIENNISSLPHADQRALWGLQDVARSYESARITLQQIYQANPNLGESELNALILSNPSLADQVSSLKGKGYSDEDIAKLLKTYLKS